MAPVLVLFARNDDRLLSLSMNSSSATWGPSRFAAGEPVLRPLPSRTAQVWAFSA
jgi:hypothetical protein